MPARMTAQPASIRGVTGSPRYTAAEAFASTGLRKVTEVARTAPIARSSRKYSRKPRPDDAAPRNTTSAHARGPGSACGQVSQARGASAIAAMPRLPVVSASGSMPASFVRA